MTSTTPRPEAATTTATPPPAGDLPITIRLATVADHPFLFSSWLKSYQGSAFARPIRSGTFFDRHHGVIERILERPGTVVTVATPAGDEDTILGWSVRENDVLHYVYVKESFRRYGLATRLCAALTPAARYTHRTSMVERILRDHPEAQYDPYLL